MPLIIFNKNQETKVRKSFQTKPQELVFFLLKLAKKCNLSKNENNDEEKENKKVKPKVHWVISFHFVHLLRKNY
jgi:hypothetical protein